MRQMMWMFRSRWAITPRSNHTNQMPTTRRSYSRHLVLWEDQPPKTSSATDDDNDKDDTTTGSTKITIDEAMATKLAHDYNQRRATYKQRVSQLRKTYAQQIAQQRAADKAAQEALEKQRTRLRLERQRRKNERSARNAQYQAKIRKQRHQEWQAELQRQQLIRDAKKERFAKARQLVINELEQEAPLWLTTVEEVEQAFASPEKEQLLWAKPGGILGAPNPSLDAHFWEYETHTNHVDKIYMSQRQVLLQQLQDESYEQANIDSNYWQHDGKQDEWERLQRKAKLRAMVQSAGRRELLKKQRQMLSDLVNQQTDREGIPQAMPVLNRKVLSNVQALEQEGAQVLLDDPTKFFVFSSDATRNESSASPTQDDDDHDDTSSSSFESKYSGPTLGSPIGLRDPLREGNHQQAVFPMLIGKIPKPDLRTEREKKKQERQERMWAAAQAEALEQQDIALAAEQQTVEDLEPDINYDENEWDSDEEDWNKGLDPVGDTDLLNVPRERRYGEDDIDWVLERLEGEVHHLEQQLAQDMEGLKRTAEAETRAKAGTDEPFTQDSVEAALMALSGPSLLALSDLDDRYMEGGMSEEELTEACKNIDGLTEEQVLLILQRNRAEEDEDEK